MERKRGGKASPIKSEHEIKMIYMTLRGYGHFRDAELLLIGCNCALRISDLRVLKFSEIIESTHEGERIGIYETKEQKTGKTKEFVLNSVAMDSMDRLKNLHPESIYLFQSVARQCLKNPKPVSASWVWRVFNKSSIHLSLPYRFSTHTMRKTFGYNAYGNGTPVEVLQKLFNHHSPQETLNYIGVTQEKVNETYIGNVIGKGIGY